MPESTASIELLELQSEVGSFLGYGRGANFADTTWDTPQQQAIDSVIKSGSHVFHHPPVLPGDSRAHAWSFLKPVKSFTLPSGENAVELPSDFGGIAGEVSLISPTGQRAEPIPLVGIGMLDRMRSQTDPSSGPPQAVAIQPMRGTTGDRGQRFQLAVFPDADAEYVLEVAYSLVPNFMTADNPYPYGGPVHRETMLEACLMVAETRMNDMSGVHRALFMERLMASVSHDRKFQPQLLGYNGNRREDPRAYQYDSRLVTNDGLYS